MGVYWYRPYEGRWFVASSYNGPWTFIELSRVPRVLIDHPLAYWRVPPDIIASLTQSSERTGEDGNMNNTGIETETGEPGGTDDRKEEVVRSEAEDMKSMVGMRAGEGDGLT